MRTFFLIVFGLIVIVVVSGVGYASYRLYSILPENTAPSQAEYPQAALDLLKISFERVFPRSDPDSDRISFFLASEIVGSPPAEDVFKSLIDKSSPLNTPDLNVWMVDFLLLRYWIRFRYTEKEVLTTYLGIHRYGIYQWKGLEEAAQGFFGVSAKDLTLPEMAVLVVNFKAPFGLDPLCYKNNVREDVVQLLERYKKTFPEAQFDADQMFVRLQPRKCYREKN